VPAIAIPVKTAREVDRGGLVEAKADYPVGDVREHPAFIYAVLLLSSVTVESGWLIRSPDFNRMAYRRTTGDREILEFRGTHCGTTATRDFGFLPLRSASGC
jgi:hypothetical protein